MAHPPHPLRTQPRPASPRAPHPLALASRFTSIKDVAPLGALRNLQLLQLDDTDIHHVRGLGACPLTEVSFDGCSNLSNVDELAMCTGLECLDLSSTLVTDVAALCACRLRTLMLNSTPLEDVHVLGSFDQLERLFINRTRIADLSGLGACAALTDVHLRGTSVSEESLAALRDHRPDITLHC